uniref:Reverse transcriptase domain-containing protein n=1 Tax=Tanacetum cinerariifolium TaxID=118510 RepID=A0A699JB87_TANCI|nr:reverse transcriptase domain-containing protein [Tanacetum cinerariifolium]
MKKLIIELPTLTTPTPKETLFVYLDTSKDVTLYTKEASSLKGVGAGLVLIDPAGTEYTYAIRLTFPSTNNEAEYDTLLAGLRISHKMKVQALKDSSDEDRPVRHGRRSIVQKNHTYLMLRCVKKLQANYIIREVHEGACRMHTVARSVVAKIMRRGYYWLTMHRDAKDEVDKCDSCQIHALMPRLPKIRLTYIMSLWPFYQWGLDILRPLLEGPEKLKFIIVAIDYFTKWMEA